MLDGCAICALLVALFHIPGITPEARALLQTYDWPGNIRELENAIERAVVLGSADTIGVEDLPGRVRDLADGGSQIVAGGDHTERALEHRSSGKRNGSRFADGAAVGIDVELRSSGHRRR